MTLADSQMAIVNGIGYDAWASQLLDANPASGRVVLDVGNLVGPAGRATTRTSWYSPGRRRSV